MKIRYTELSSGNGGANAAELRIQDFELNELIIGRGGRSTLLLLHRSLSLEHVSITELKEGLFVKDRSSLSGIRINHIPVREAVVKEGDIISLGSIDLTVSKENDFWVLLYQKHYEETVDLTQTLSKLSITHYLPRIELLSSAVVIILLVVYGILPFISEKKQSHSIGPLTRHHSFLEKNCAACHTNSFHPATDDGCKSCHTIQPHFNNNDKNFTSFHSLQMSGEKNCLSCHTEHQGHATHVDNRQCTTCHGGIENSPNINLKNSVDWLSHPDFAKKTDEGSVKLNHQVHMKPGLRGDSGPEDLTCKSCHISDAKGVMKPIVFETNCARCHSLEFDDQLPGIKVPHGNVESVLIFLQREYASLALGGHRGSETKGDVERLIPASKSDSLLFDKLSVVKQVRSAEETIFNKTGCQLCHTVTANQQTPISNEFMSMTPLYDVKKGKIPHTWYQKAHFSHNAHSQLECKSCHKDVTRSTKSTDLLLPVKSDCLDCHVSSKALSQCVTCHDFHNSEERQKGIK